MHPYFLIQALASSLEARLEREKFKRQNHILLIISLIHWRFFSGVKIMAMAKELLHIVDERGEVRVFGIEENHLCGCDDAADAFQIDHDGLVSPHDGGGVRESSVQHTKISAREACSLHHGLLPDLLHRPR